MKLKGIMFVDESNQDLDFEDLVAEIQTKAELNHWKAATRKLKKLQKGFSNPVPQEVYLSTLRACMADRLNGARAAEPARRILEVMSENEYPIPKDVINYCILNSLGDGPDGTHDNCGGIDCALAMMATVDKSMISEEAFGRLATVLAKAGDLKEAEAMLRVMIVDESMTPQLGVLADVAMAIATSNQPDVSSTMNILALAKAAGYQLDNIASTVDGRSLLGAGLIAAEKINNVALGLRLLTAASQAKGCDPDRGDALVSSASSSVQRAATLIHKSAIKKAVEDGSWKVAVKLMELMTERSLRVSPAIWKSVVTCCAKNEKSRKATQLLLDWVRVLDIFILKIYFIRCNNLFVMDFR
jgi:PPR repeat